MNARIADLEESWRQRIQQIMTDFEVEKEKIKYEMEVKALENRERLIEEYERRIADQSSEYEVRSDNALSL